MHVLEVPSIPRNILKHDTSAWRGRLLLLRDSAYTNGGIDEEVGKRLGSIGVEGGGNPAILSKGLCHGGAIRALVIVALSGKVVLQSQFLSSKGSLLMVRFDINSWP
jgi:hypothetical protein